MQTIFYFIKAPVYLQLKLTVDGTLIYRRLAPQMPVIGTLSNEDGNVIERRRLRKITFLVRCCNVLVVSTTLKKVFPRCNYSENFVQVLSSMHFNVQLLYIYYCSLPSSSASPSSLLKVPNHSPTSEGWKAKWTWQKRESHENSNLGRAWGGLGTFRQEVRDVFKCHNSSYLNKTKPTIVTDSQVSVKKILHFIMIYNLFRKTLLRFFQSQILSPNMTNLKTVTRAYQNLNYYFLVDDQSKRISFILVLHQRVPGDSRE